MILITGGTGYIGSHVLNALYKNGQREIVVFDNLEFGNKFILEYYPEVKFVQGDLRNSEDLGKLDAFDINSCMHFAAYASVGESISDPKKYFLNNYVGSVNLLNYLVNLNKFKNFVFSSTSEVYGEAEYVPLDEKHTLKPINPYGLSKKMVEDTLVWYQKSYGMNFVTLRYFNAAGCSVDGQIGEMHNPENHLIPNAVLGSLGLKEFKLTCSKVDTPDKTPIRDYVHVDDLADAHLKALNYLKEGNESDNFNLGSGVGYSVLEVVKEVEKVTGIKINFNSGEIRQGEPAKKYASNQKAKERLKWVPKYGLNDMIKTTFDFFKSDNYKKFITLSR